MKWRWDRWLSTRKIYSTHDSHNQLKGKLNCYMHTETTYTCTYCYTVYNKWGYSSSTNDNQSLHLSTNHPSALKNKCELKITLRASIEQCLLSIVEHPPLNGFVAGFARRACLVGLVFTEIPIKIFFQIHELIHSLKIFLTK